MKLQWIQVILAPTAAIKITQGIEDKGSTPVSLSLTDRELIVECENKHWDAESKTFTIDKTMKIMNLDNAIAWEYKELPVG